MTRRDPSSPQDAGPGPDPRTPRRVPPRGREIGVTPASSPPPRKATCLSPRGAGRSARGPLLVSVDAEVARRFGEEGRERVVALLPDAHAEELRAGRPSVLDAHDLEVVKVYADIAARVLGLDAAAFQDIGRASVDRELAPFLKTLVLPGRLVDVVRRSFDVIGRFADFGTWSLKTTMPELCTVRVEDFGAMPPCLRAWYLGVIEGILRRSVSPDVVVVDVTSSDEPAGVFEFEASAF